MAQQTQFLRAKTSQNLATGALNFTTSFVGNFQLAQVLFGFSGSISQAQTVVFNSRDGAAYDATLDSNSLSSVTSYAYRPSGGCIFMDGDQVTITLANSGTPAVTAYVTVIAEPLGQQAVGTISKPGL